MTQSALLDGGTIHAAGATFQKLSSRLSIRPINILALFSLLDSYVLFERLVVPEINWKYFQSFAPPDWVNYLEDVVEPVSIQFDAKGLKSFLADPYVFWLLQAMLHIDKTLMLEYDYRSYTGADFGTLREQSTSDELAVIEQAIKKFWKSDNEALDWQYNAANAEHIDLIHASWRGCSYSQYSADHGYWYIPHELRGQLLNLHAAFDGYEQSEPLVKKVVAAFKENYFDQHKAALDGLPKKFIPQRPKSELLWQEFRMPLVSGVTFQKSETIYDLFDKADELRRSAAPFRAACAEADRAEAEGRPDKAAKLYGQLADLFKDVGKSYDAPHINWSMSYSPPWKVSISASKPKTGPRHLSFVRDIYSSRMLPLTFQTDLIRLFGQDPSDWLRKNGREEMSANPRKPELPGIE